MKLGEQAPTHRAEARHVHSRRVGTRQFAAQKGEQVHDKIPFVHRVRTQNAHRWRDPRHQIRPLTDPEPLAKRLGRIGVNVNQIAHWANANEHITAEQVAELRASFDRIEARLLLGDLFANKRTAGKDV